jgi:hypothetical protein
MPVSFSDRPIRLGKPETLSQTIAVLEAPQSQLSASGQDRWDPVMLNYAIRELRREFATVPVERIVQAVDLTARVVGPAAGSVALLRRARERLGATG